VKYKLQIVFLDGKVEFSEPVSAVLSTFVEKRYAADIFILYQNYPNRYNLETTIRFNLRQSTMVKLVIYDVNGSAVCTLTHDRLPAGIHNLFKKRLPPSRE